MSHRNQDAVAVVGIGCRFPDADDLHAFWGNLKAGRQSFSPVPRDRWDHRPFFSTGQRDVDKTWTQSGSFIADIKSFAALHFGIPPRRVEVMDPQHRLLIEATRVAIQDAGYEAKGFERARTGVFTGLTVAEFKNLALARIGAMQMAAGEFGPAAASKELRELLLEMTQNVVPLRAFSISGGLTNMAAASIAQAFDLGGPAYSIDAACSSGAVAIHNAILHLRAGLLDVAFAGGTYLNLTPDNLVAFTRVGAISPSGVCRPFDHRADGFVQGDGAGILMLKRLADAEKDGDRIHGVIRGAGCNNDARGEGPMTPRIEGQLAVLEMAYRDAGVSPASIAYFEAHGTATRVGDPVEIEALGRTLLDAGVSRKDAPLVGSAKANVGHTMSAAGVAGLIKALRMVDERVAPPLAGFEAPHPAIHLERWPLHFEGQLAELRPRAGEPLRVGVSAFGFGGTNVHFVVEEPPGNERIRARRRPAVEWPEALVVTAPNLPLLASHAKELAEAIDGPRTQGVSLAEIAWTLNATRRYERFRLVVAGERRADVTAELRTAAEALEAVAGTKTFPLKLSPRLSVLDGGTTAPLAKKVCLLFPGQGAQRVGLLKDLARRFPRFLAVFSSLEAAVADLTERPLSSYLWPELPAGDAQLLEAHERALTATEICQPAMAALGLSLAGLLRDAGVEADVSLGHSLGEFVAMANGGILDASAAVRLVAARGKAMAELPIEDHGAMAAVSAPAEEVRQAIGELPGVWICNFNHPRQVAISGTTAAVAEAIHRLLAKKLDVQRLPVSHAFHSPLLEPMQPAMAALSRDIEVRPPRHVVASCISKEAHSSDPARSHRVMLEHSTAPVNFVRGLEQAREAGAAIFVQAGAGSMLTSFARATLGGEGIETVTLAGMEPDGGLELMRGLALLSAHGLPVRFLGVFPEESRRVVDLPATPLQREEYWVVKKEPQLLPRLEHPLPEADARFGVVDLPKAEPKDAEATPPVQATPDLLALFARQAEVLRQHAEIIAAQNRLLGVGGHTLLSTSTDAPAVAANTASPPGEAPTWPAPPLSSVRAPAPPEDLARSNQALEGRVLDIVAKVSAFPRASLSPKQRLVGELGFDSLMVVDLVKALDTAFPEAGGLRPSSFSMETTVGDLIGMVARPPSHPEQEDRPTELAPRTEAPLSTYEVVVRPAPLVTAERSARGEVWALVEDGGPLPRALAEALARAGAEVLRLQLTKETLARPERLEPGALHLWPESAAELLVPAIERTGRSLAGLIYASGLGDARGLLAKDRLGPLHALVRHAKIERLFVLTSMGGKLGLLPSDALAPHILDAGLLGYVKSLAKERQDAVVRAIDIDPSSPAVACAEQLVGELLSGDREPEVGLFVEQRWLPELRLLDDPSLARSLGKDDTVLITGGAGDLGRSIARDLSRQGVGGLILAGRRPLTPELTAFLAELEGTRASYVSVDVSDRAATERALAVAQEGGPPINVVIHAAGLVEDARVEKKSPESMSRVFAAKVETLKTLLAIFPRLDRLLLLGSWAGRFGNAGQTDYAAANEILARVAVTHEKSHGALVIDWPPWTSSGMARAIPGEARRMMAASGVTFVSDGEGVAMSRALLTSGAQGLRVVGRGLPRRLARTGRELEISVTALPYLEDHRLRGEPVLPLAAATDLLVEHCRDALSLEGPIALEALELVRGVVASQPLLGRLFFEATSESSGRVELQLRDPGQGWVVAYRARARAEASPLSRIALEGPDEERPFDVATFYARHTFHGPRLQGISEITRMTRGGIEGVLSPSQRRALVPATQQESWAVDPVILDAGFQLAGYWALVHHHKAGYPTGFGRLVLLRPFGTERVHATVVVREASEDHFAGDIRFTGADGAPYAVLEGVEGRLMPVESEVLPKALPKVNGHGNGTKNGHQTEVIAKERWDIRLFPEVEALDQRLEMAQLIGLKNPYFSLHEGTARNRSVIDGVEMLNFSSYNYLGFSGHPEVIAAAQEAIERYGTSVSASRVASGERPIHRALERGIAEHLGVEDAVVMVSGHATNVTTIGTLIGPDDVVIHDSLIHESILAGIRQSGAARRPYPHAALDALDRTLGTIRGAYRRALIVAEGIYSMDGDVSDLPRLIELKKRHQALLMIDEAHSIGVLGPNGRGVGHHFPGVDPNDVDVWMGTLSKSFASCGGYIAGSKALVRLLKYSAGGFVYSAGITPPNCAAALKSLELMRREPHTVERLRTNSRRFLELAKARGLDTGLAIGAAVVPVIVGNSLDALKLGEALQRRKINVNPIVYPAVEDDAARLRFFLSATHTEDELRFAAEATKEELEKIRHGEDSAAVASPG